MRVGARRDSTRVLRSLLESFQCSDDDPAGCAPSAPSRYGKLVEQARLSPRLLTRLQLMVVAIAGATFGILGPITALLCFVCGTSGLFVYVRVKARGHRMAVDRDLPALLTAVASSVRAGIDPLSALIGAREYFPKDAVLVQELEKVRRGLREGREEEQLLQEFLAPYASRESELFKSCVLLSRRHGGSLSDSLHRITKVVRQRQSFRRKTKAALAMHRMSAIGIALCAVAMAVLQFGMNPQSLEIALNHPTGSKVLGGGVVFIGFGLGWMLTMGKEAKLQ